VQAALEAIMAQVEAAQAAGESAADILGAYQDGSAFSQGDILPDSPLTPEQLTAAADAVMQPRRELAQPEILAAVANMVAAGGRSDADLAQVLGSPTHFGPQTGAIRGVLEGVAALQLTADQLQEMAAQLRAGVLPQDYLSGQGYRPGLARAFQRDLSGLGAGISVPQTTRAAVSNPGAAAPTTTTEGEAAS
jgi:hypothetical protein